MNDVERGPSPPVQGLRLESSLLTVWKEFGRELELVRDGPTFRPEPNAPWLSPNEIEAEIALSNPQLLWVPVVAFRGRAWDIGQPSSGAAWSHKIRSLYIRQSEDGSFPLREPALTATAWSAADGERVLVFETQC